MKTVLKILFLMSILSSCKQEINKRESILDNISHIEDSIYTHVDSLPRLFDELKVKKQFINIGDCNLYCEVEGNGTPIVLINGGPGGTHHCFHPWFSQARDFCKLIYYDQRGCGQSDFYKGDGYTFRQAIDDLDKLRQALKIEKWIVCGYSYGGALAQYYASKYPENVLGMVLIGSATLLHDDALNETREYKFISKEEENKINEIYDLYDQGKISLFQLDYNKDLNGDWKRQNFIKPTKEELIRGALYEWVNDEGFNQSMWESYSRYDFKNVFDNCPIPTLLCEGEWDLTWAAEKKHIFKENHPNARFELFENSGHTIFSEECELFFSILRKYIKNLKPATHQQIQAWKKQSNKLIAPQEELFENEELFFSIIADDGIDKALEYYNKLRSENKVGNLFSEGGLNSLGYSYLNKKQCDVAIKIFELNVESFPDSWNVYDSLGEAYLVSGNKEKAKENYKKSIELNPDNENGKKMLNEIKMTNEV